MTVLSTLSNVWLHLSKRYHNHMAPYCSQLESSHYHFTTQLHFIEKFQVDYFPLVPIPNFSLPRSHLVFSSMMFPFRQIGSYQHYPNQIQCSNCKAAQRSSGSHIPPDPSLSFSCYSAWLHYRWPIWCCYWTVSHWIDPECHKALADNRYVSARNALGARYSCRLPQAIKLLVSFALVWRKKYPSFSINRSYLPRAAKKRNDNWSGH